MESTSQTRPPVVLIAEDDPGSLMALAACLELEGYEAVPATDSETALACYDERGGQIDFVITVLARLRKGQSGEGARS